MLDWEIGLRAAANAVDPEIQLDDRVAYPFRFDQ
jgi:hypothetical protein